MVCLPKNFIGTSGIASAAILNPENENFQFPTLEPGFDLLSDDWFQVNVTETGKKIVQAFLDLRCYCGGHIKNL